MSLEKKYTGSGYGTYGRFFQINIYEDLESEPDLLTFQIDGCRIDYRPEAEDFMPGVVPSELTFGMLVEDATMETYIKSLIKVEDRSVYIEVLSGEDEVDWRGWLMVDNIVLEDGVLPYTVELTAVDGLKDLENIDWDNLTEELTVVQVLLKAIEKIGTDVMYAGEHIITTSVDWYEDQMPARSLLNDPMHLTQIYGAAFYERTVGSEGYGQYAVDDNGNPVPYSYFDVLVELCTAFNARLMMCRGTYQFINPFTAYTDTTAKVHRYDKLLNMTASNEYLNISVDKTDYSRDSGGVDTLLPQAWRVRSKYNHWTGNSIFSKYSATVNYGTTWQLAGYGVAGTGNYLKMDFITLGSIQEITGLGYPQVYLICEVAIRVGSYYLVGDSTLPGSMAWSLTPGYYRQRSPMITSSPLSPYITNYVFIVNIVTPDIVADGAIEYTLNTLTVINAQPPFQDLTALFMTVIAVFYNVNIYHYLNSIAQTSINYSSELAAPNKTVYELETKDVSIGDGITAASAGALKVYNGSAWVYTTGVWRVKDTGVDYALGELRCIEIHGLCFQSVYMLQGSWFGLDDTRHPTLDRMYQYVSENYVASLGTYDYDEQTLSGEMYRISEHTMETLTVDSELIETLPQWKWAAGKMGDVVINTGDVFNKWIVGNGITQLGTGIEAGEPVAELPIDTTVYKAIKQGDKVIVFRIDTGETQEFDVNLDVGGEDIVIKVDLDTADYTFPAGSLVFHKGNYQAYLIQNGLMEQVTTATLLQTEWVDNGTYWVYTQADTNILATHFVVVAVANASADDAGMLLPTNDSYAGGVYVYASSEPTVDIDVSYTIHFTKDITPT